MGRALVRLLTRFLSKFASKELVSGQARLLVLSPSNPECGERFDLLCTL